MEYQLIRKAIKHIYIRVRDGRVIVTAPYGVSRSVIDAFVASKTDWIAKHQRQSEILPDAERVKLLMDAYFDRWEPFLGVHAKERRVRKMKTRWGSCNVKEKRIWLSSYLGAYPEECLEYVIVHELCHLLERGHNKRFYALVASCLPDWKERKAKLKEGLG